MRMLESKDHELAVWWVANVKSAPLAGGTITASAAAIYLAGLWRRLGEKIITEPLAHLERRAEVESVDHGQAETSRRHGVTFRRKIFVECDLQTGKAGAALEVIHQRHRRMAILHAMRAEQNDAETAVPFRGGKRPGSALI